MFKKYIQNTSAILGLILSVGFVNAYELTQSNDSIVFKGLEKNNKLLVTSPNGTIKSFTINSDHFILSAAKLRQSQLHDGLYKFELVPHYNGGSLATQIRNSNNQSLADDYAETYKNKQVNQSGVFTIAKHSLVKTQSESRTKDQVVLDDQIIDGSLCVGFDCVNGESFGFDTIRLKENNVRIKFQDTSSSASFPSNDWQITANDSANGGANKFSIDDIDGGRTPFTLEAGAPSHSLYVDSAGRVGLGTSNPVVELHVVNGDSPALRLEQNGSAGFGAQTWDIAGNETNFFVRDATNGSKLPFKIRPSAPTNSLYVNTNGDIGLGTSTPDARLHVIGGSHVTGATQLDGSLNVTGATQLDGSLNVTGVTQLNGGLQLSSLQLSGSDGNTNLKIEETNATKQNRVMMNLVNNGGSEIQFNNSDIFGTNWLIRADSDDSSFIITKTGLASPSFQITAGGDIVTSGTVQHTSDRNKKKNIKTVNAKNILEKVIALPISTWQYKAQDNDVTHMGPMAQDFSAAFGLGINDVTISDTDVAGVALAAIKALKSELDQRGSDMQKLQETNSQLEQRLFNLEAKFFAKEKSLVQQ